MKYNYTSYYCPTIGAVYRYYESRRRAVNDARPERRAAAEAAKKRAKRKQLRQNVGVIFIYHA